MNNYKDWIGKKISRSDIITPRLVDHLKKTIDQNCLSDPVSYTHLTLPTNREV